MTFASQYGLTIRKLVPPFTNKGGSVTLGEESIIQAGAGLSEYMSFGDMAIDTNNKIHLIYRQGVGHNIGTDGHVRYRTSVDGGDTFSAPVIIVVDGAGSYNVTNPSITISSTGRIIVFFDKQDLPVSLFTQRTYCIYSDDNGLTWNSNGNDGNEILLINDRPDTYLRSIGHAVEPTAGVLIFPQYSKNTNEFARILKSVDDGLTWTFVTNITDGTPATLNNGGETCLEIRSDKVIIANIRSEASPGGNWTTYSLDGGSTWYPKPWQIGVTRGKNIIAKSTKGTILTASRDDATNYSVYGYSTNGGFSFTYDRIDNRTNYNEYAGIVWDPVNNRFVVVYWFETGTISNSPTTMIRRFIYEG